MKDLDSLNKLFEYAGNAQTYQKGDYIFHIDEVILGIYKVKKGRVKLWRGNEGHSRGLTFHLVHPGELFGVMDYFIGSKTRNYIASSLDDNVVLEYIPLSEFENKLTNSTVLKFIIIKLLGTRLKTSWEKYVELKNYDSQQLILKALIKMGKERGTKTDTGFLIEGISHQELADYFGASRQNVSTVLNRLRRKGIIEYDRSQILVRCL